MMCKHGGKPNLIAGQHVTITTNETTLVFCLHTMHNMMILTTRTV